MISVSITNPGPKVLHDAAIQDNLDGEGGLQMPKIDLNQIKEFIEIDFPRHVRFTHYPSGDTCLKQPWMASSRKGDDAWNEKRKEFFSKHPNAHLVVTAFGHEIVDDVRNFPFMGGGFEIGDEVVSMDGKGELIVRVITSRDTSENLFFLEDGTLLYWSDADDGWFTDDKTPYGTGYRARKPLEGEDLPRYQPEAAAPAM